MNVSWLNKFLKFKTKTSVFIVELSVGMTTEGIDVRSVGNTLILHETALIEAFNLKAAIEYQLKNCKYCTSFIIASNQCRNKFLNGCQPYFKFKLKCFKKLKFSILLIMK